VIGYVKDAVPRSLGKGFKIHAPDFGLACRKAKSELAVAEKKWRDADSPMSGPVYQEFIAAKVTAMVMCAFVGQAVL
jgi:hypothetical protein